jgi:uncharacterized protein YyaL (SSP411 family)
LYYRNYKNGKASIPGFLDDQVFMIEAFIESYRSVWSEDYLLKAKTLTEKVIEHYYDDKTGSFYFTGKDQHQPVLRTKEIMDNVIPSSNSVMANNLYMLGHYFYNEEWIRMSKNLCLAVKEQAVKHGPYLSNWASVMLGHTHGNVEVAITGPLPFEKMKAFYQIPGLILMVKTEEKTSIPLLADKPNLDSLAIYICKDKACGLPVNNVESALKQIEHG